MFALRAVGFFAENLSQNLRRRKFRMSRSTPDCGAPMTTRLFRRAVKLPRLSPFSAGHARGSAAVSRSRQVGLRLYRRASANGGRASGDEPAATLAPPVKFAKNAARIVAEKSTVYASVRCMPGWRKPRSILGWGEAHGRERPVRASRELVSMD